MGASDDPTQFQQRPAAIGSACVRFGKAPERSAIGATWAGRNSLVGGEAKVKESNAVTP